MTSPPPSTRKVAAAGLIVLIITLWALLIAIFAPFVSRWPVLVQAPFYLIMGIGWIIPLKPLLRWSETGAWKALADPQRNGSKQDGSGQQG